MQVAERPLGVFSRQLFLGVTLDTDHIKASYDAGVPTLRIPVARAGQAAQDRDRQHRRRPQGDQRLRCPGAVSTNGAHEPAVARAVKCAEPACHRAESDAIHR